MNIEEFRQFCEDKLAAYKIPQKIFFTTDMPTNATGKIMKSRLVEEFSAKQSG
jgi:acyl-CoA synthetase (AMP-forming)/AMP-acid ligase II